MAAANRRTGPGASAGGTGDAAAGREAGFVLVGVLAIVALFVAASASFAVKARLHLLQAANRQDAARLQALADGAALFAADALRPAPGEAGAPAGPPALPADGRSVSCALGGGGARLVLSAQDQGGLLDLNGAPAAMLADLFAAAGMGGIDAARLAAEIVDFRDPDDAPEGNGIGEAASYAAAGLAWGPRNAPFADADEVGQLPSAALAARLRPLLTVNNPRAAIDVAATGPAARALLPERAGQLPAVSRWTAPSPRTDFAVEARLLRADGSLGAGRRALVSFRESPDGAVRILRWSRSAPLGGDAEAGGERTADPSPLCAALAGALQAP